MSSLLHLILIGLFDGIVSTAVMTLTEVQSWKKWGLVGVFEWHENQMIITRLIHHSDNDREKVHFIGIFSLHFLNGALAGMVFPFVVSVFTLLTVVTMPVTVLLGIIYGFVLWILTLVPIHKPITRFSPWNHPLGHMPALASLSGHIIYGLVLSIIATLTL